MPFRELVRETPAGQLARQFLGWTIAPYEDEKEGYCLPKTKEQEAAEGTEKSEDEWDADFDSDHNARWWEAREIGYESDAVSDYHNEPYKEKSDVERLDEKASTPDYQEVAFSEDDSENPQNWSQAKKAFTFFQICLLTLCVYCSSSIIVPAESIFILEWGASQQIASLVLSMYVLGYGLGPLIFSPMSEMSMVGRGQSYMSSLFIYIILTAVGSGVSNLPGLIVIRLLQGFFGGPVLSMGAATAADLYAFHKVPYAVSVWGVFSYGGPAIGPTLSSFAVPLDSWRWSMWETLIFSGLMYLLLFFCLPETNADYILTQRAKRLRMKTGNDDLMSRSEKEASGKDWKKLTVYHLTMPFRITVQDPSVAFINIYTGLVYGVFYSFFESFPLAYNGIHGFNLGIIGIVFNAVLIGAIVGMAVYYALLYYVYEPYTLREGVGVPEYRLVPALFGAALAPCGMFIFGYASKSGISWVAPTTGICLYTAAGYILVNCIFVYLPIGYPRYAASIFASNGLLRSAFGVAAIHFSPPLFNNLGVGDGCALLGGLAAGCAILLMGLWYWGASLRARSKFADTY